MKKLLLFAAILIMASCSNEMSQTVETNENSSLNLQYREGETDEIELLYNEMINSENYILAERMRNDFIDKMKFTGDISLINSEESLLGWINENVTNTDFINFEVAREQFRNIEFLSHRVLLENERFFESIKLQPGRFLILIGTPNPPQTVNCSECKSGLLRCVEINVERFSNSFIDAITDYTTHTITAEDANEKLNNARIIFRIGNDLCQDDFERCCI